MIGRAHNHGVERFVVEHGSHVGDGPAGIDAKGLCRLVASLFVAVAHVRDFDVGHALDQPRIVGATAATTDQTDGDLFVGAIRDGTCGSQTGRCGDPRRGDLQKSATVGGSVHGGTP